MLSHNNQQYEKTIKGNYITPYKDTYLFKVVFLVIHTSFQNNSLIDLLVCKYLNGKPSTQAWVTVLHINSNWKNRTFTGATAYDDQSYYGNSNLFYQQKDKTVISRVSPLPHTGYVSSFWLYTHFAGPQVHIVPSPTVPVVYPIHEVLGSYPSLVLQEILSYLENSNHIEVPPSVLLVDRHSFTVYICTSKSFRRKY